MTCGRGSDQVPVGKELLLEKMSHLDLTFGKRLLRMETDIDEN